MQTSIHVHQLCKSYVGSQVLKNVSFKVEKGTIAGLLGPNGSGKTTIVRLLNGVILPDSGDMQLHGYSPITDGDAIRRISGVVTEGAGLYHEMSGVDNLRFFAKLYDCYDEKRIQELLEQFGLAEAQKRAVGKYSTGMKKRLALAKAILPKPQILFLDEPTNGLDPEGVQQVLTDLKKMNEEEGTTIILCSHVLHQLETICDCYLFLQDGTIIEQGTKEEIEDKYLRQIKLRVKTGVTINGDSYAGYPAQALDRHTIVLELPSKEAIPGLLSQMLQEAWVHEVEIVNNDLESLYFQVRSESGYELAAYTSHCS
ncbi:ABC transporter ATP-binding protein [Paenibacillus xylaniclasticus]|uniref:ABC transporter ATP-binding protein n=1 Tax=Paenibacillus xylaniclasticus TaxID=588083 RepID=UPI000FD86E44|nr:MULTISPECIES: ABC transporter ATP-binding protein [Paenibacillus]GFN31391.1 hypothetical protein PCURB6_16510 [Paenibacillus curdlanolyticus]